MKWGYVRHAESNLFNPFIKVTSISKNGNENFQGEIIIKFHPNQTQITSFSLFTLILFSPSSFFYPHRSLTLALRSLLSLSDRGMTQILDQMHENTDPKLLKINLSDLHHIKTIGKGCFSTIWLVKFDKKYFALKIYEKLKIQQLRRVFI